MATLWEAIIPPPWLSRPPEPPVPGSSDARVACLSPHPSRFPSLAHRRIAPRSSARGRFDATDSADLLDLGAADAPNLDLPATLRHRALQPPPACPPPGHQEHLPQGEPHGSAR